LPCADEIFRDESRVLVLTAHTKYQQKHCKADMGEELTKWHCCGSSSEDTQELGITRLLLEDLPEDTYRR
jgi:hypothetical protein